MIIELETGVRSDGTILARRGRPDHRQRRLQHGRAVSWARWPRCSRSGRTGSRTSTSTADVVYTNTQPSGSVRAPTGPTTCWALEQHHDVVAERLGLDPVEFRRRNLVHEGDAGPTGQVFERIGVLETLEQCGGGDRLGPPLPDGEAIGIATGWWPSFPGASGAH